MMLVMGMKYGERIRIGENITVMIDIATTQSGKKARRIYIDAPRDLKIRREEPKAPPDDSTARH